MLWFSTLKSGYPFNSAWPEAGTVHRAVQIVVASRFIQHRTNNQEHHSDCRHHKHSSFHSQYSFFGLGLNSPPARGHFLRSSAWNAGSAFCASVIEARGAQSGLATWLAACGSGALLQPASTAARVADAINIRTRLLMASVADDRLRQGFRLSCQLGHQVIHQG